MSEQSEYTNLEQSTKPNYQTVEGLKAHTLWSQLTSKQQKFVLLYIESGGNRIDAAKGAFLPRSEKNADSMAHKLLKIYAIKKLLSLYFGHEIEGSALNRGEFLLILADRLRDPDCSNEQWVKMAQMHLALKGWKTRPLPLKPQSGSQKPIVDPEDVDAIVRRLEKAQENEE